MGAMTARLTTVFTEEKKKGQLVYVSTNHKMGLFFLCYHAATQSQLQNSQILLL